MRVDMMEKHPLGSQAFVPMEDSSFFGICCSERRKTKYRKIKSFIVPKQMELITNPVYGIFL